MVLNSDVVTVIAIVVASFSLLRWLESRLGHRIGESEQSLVHEQKIAELKQDMDEQRERYESIKRADDERIHALEGRVTFLIEELQNKGIRVRDLEKVIAEKSMNSPSLRLMEESASGNDLLVVCGDTAMCELDRRALRRANVRFKRTVNATKAEIVSELRRRRQDNNMYKWMHVSSHANKEGVHLVDGIAEPAWWNENVTGVDVIFLAACQTSAVADELAGLACVVFVKEDIDTQDAADFTYAFWRRMNEHGDPRRAYAQAVKEVPQVDEYTDIRTG